jgi:hypothetical protein
MASQIILPIVKVKNFSELLDRVFSLNVNILYDTYLSELFVRKTLSSVFDFSEGYRPAFSVNYGATSSLWRKKSAFLSYPHFWTHQASLTPSCNAVPVMYFVAVLPEAKANLSLCFIKYRTLKTYLLLD